MKQHTQRGSEIVPPPQVVNTPEALASLVERLSQEPLVAIDTEANSFYAYREHVCLIQLSVPGTNYLVDPLALEDLSSMGPFFISAEVEKVFHAADYDLLVLHQDLGLKCCHLFDTMWAARVLGWPKVGLAHILETYFGVHINKRYQRYDWGRRPLEEEALTYAWMDSYYLLDLREIQIAELTAKGRMEEAQEIFQYLCQSVTEHHEHNSDEHFWRIKGVHDLSAHEQKVLYQLHCWRERTAEALDRPTVKVMADGRLVRMARVQPRNRQELLDANLTPYQVGRFGSDILEALRGPWTDVPDSPFVHARPAPEVVERYHILKVWRKEIAAQRGVDSDVILPNAVLWELSEHPPTSLDDLVGIAGIGPWRRQAYGPDILRLMRGV
ncbi:MAG: HRDC domain-containing protein [Anaerolineae bacterium]|nr:HRDC domain-containing protein [Anaerolineae bacterium]